MDTTQIPEDIAREVDDIFEAVTMRPFRTYAAKHEVAKALHAERLATTARLTAEFNKRIERAEG